MKKLHIACLLGLGILLWAPSLSEARTWYVKVDGTGDMPTIQAAIDTAIQGDTVLIAPGRYTWTNQGTGDEYGLIKFLRGTTGFKFLSESGAEATILDAQKQGRVAFVQGNNELTIDGFTFQNGVAPEFGYNDGGGLVGHLSSPIIRNCIFKNNWARCGGGIWYGGWNAIQVTNCLFFGNDATYGAGVFLINSQPSSTFRNCRFFDNDAISYGGAVYLYQVHTTFINCTIYDNSALEAGGGLYCNYIHTCTFKNCTFSENASADGSGIYLDQDNDALTLANCIIAFGLGGPALAIIAGSIDMACTDVYGNAGGNSLPEGTIDSGGNFSEDPRFCGSLGSHDYTLQGVSPCAPGNHPAGAPCNLIGSCAVNCGSVPVEPKSWGGIKNMFRK